MDILRCSIESETNGFLTETGYYDRALEEHIEYLESEYGDSCREVIRAHKSQFKWYPESGTGINYGADMKLKNLLKETKDLISDITSEWDQEQFGDEIQCDFYQEMIEEVVF